MTLPRGLIGRAAALAIPILVVALGWIGIAAPLLTAYRTRDARLVELNEMSARFERAAGQISGLHGALAALSARSDLADLALAGSSDAIAAANLQTSIVRLVSATGADIASMEILPSQATDEFRRVSVRVSLAADLHALAGALRGIDEARPVLFVDNLEVRAGTAGTAAVLTVTLDVFGFRQ